MHGALRSAQKAARVALDDALIAQAQQADAIVIGAPMYNSGMTVQLKDLRNAMSTANEIGFDAPITALFEQLYAQGIEHGLSDLDHAGLFVELASRNGMT